MAREGDANSTFFHMSANGKSLQNQIVKLAVGNQEHVGSEAVGQALAEHFLSFSKKGNRSW